MSELLCLECDHAKEHDIEGSGECGVGWRNDGLAPEPGQTPCECIQFEDPEGPVSDRVYARPRRVVEQGSCDVCGRTAEPGKRHPCRFEVACSCWRGVPCDGSGRVGRR